MWLSSHKYKYCLTIIKLCWWNIARSETSQCQFMSEVNLQGCNIVCESHPYHFVNPPCNSWDMHILKIWPLKVQVQGWGKISRSHNWSSDPLTHVPFVLCLVTLSFLRYNFSKTQVKVMGEIKVTKWVWLHIDSPTFHSMPFWPFPLGLVRTLRQNTRLNGLGF